jgi:glycosyltransferase involved in cell wall biosynthesis
MKISCDKMLSIVIISKNEEQCLPRLLDSIKRQGIDENKYEIILSDANSTDKTREIAQSFGCRIVDGGLPSKGRNNGARAAKGDLLLFLDSDVVLPKNFLRYNLNEFLQRKLVSGTTIYRPMSRKMVDKFFYATYNFLALITQLFSPHAGGFCIFIKKETFDDIGGFNENILFAEDMDLVKRSGKTGNFRILSGPPILCDVRRMEKEGRAHFAIKYVYAELRRMVLGDRDGAPFNYDMQGVNIKEEAQRMKKIEA